MNLLKNLKKDDIIHFIGIGGISMSGLASVLLSRGFRVTGSDMQKSDLTKVLEQRGAAVFVGHNGANVQDAKLVVYTAAVKSDNPEMVEAAKRGIDIVERPVLLGWIMNEFSKSLAVSGTHGKTTVTSMISHILVDTNTDPTISLGGNLDKIGGNFKMGKSEYFLAEACEYHRSFLNFYPLVATILNVDPDHLDYFKDKDDYESAYIDFIKNIKEGGSLVAYGDDMDVLRVIKDAKCRVIKYGTKDESANIFARDIKIENFCPSYMLVIDGKDFRRVKLLVSGMHNLLNSLAALSNAYALGLNMESSVKAIEDYTGVKRRLEKKGEAKGAKAYDDYAHHPTEITASLTALRQITKGELVLVFQPHTYTRTRLLFDEFAACLCLADRVILADIYSAREKDDGSVSSKMLEEKINETKNIAVYFNSFEKINDYLVKNVNPGDTVVTMGAGDIHKICDRFLEG